MTTTRPFDAYILVAVFDWRAADEFFGRRQYMTPDSGDILDDWWTTYTTEADAQAAADVKAKRVAGYAKRPNNEVYNFSSIRVEPSDAAYMKRIDEELGRRYGEETTTWDFPQGCKWLADKSAPVEDVVDAIIDDLAAGESLARVAPLR